MSFFVPISDIMHVTSSRLVIRKAFEELDKKPKRNSIKQKANLVNLAPVAVLDQEGNEVKKTNVSGFVTRKVRLKMTRILDTWLRCMKYSDKDRRGRPKQLPTFCTLTLPAKQMHTDGQLHKMLNYFITESWQGYGGKRFSYYFWRAERQKNGNIHYHVVFDAFIDWQHIQAKWNKILDRYGYIEAYNKNNPGGSGTPNSTDIHALKKIDDVASYVIKYCTKESEEKQKINGRVWGCSKELKGLKEAQISSHEMSFDSFVEEVKQDPNVWVKQDENVTVIFSRKIPEILNRYVRLKKRVIDHYRDLYYQLYTPDWRIKKDTLYILPEWSGKQLAKIVQSAIDFEF